MYEYLLDSEGLKVRDEVREFIKSVPRDLIRAMDEDKIQYPREFVTALGEKNLLGLRFPKEYGGRGHPWTYELAAKEEVGVLGAALGCAYAMIRAALTGRKEATCAGEAASDTGCD